jgi:hypothetical protein
MTTTSKTIETIMNRPIDYTTLAATLDYASLDKKLSQLAEGKPSKRRKTAADVLEPLRERLLALHRNGWSSGQLVSELKAAGVPISPSRLRECLNRWSNGGNSAGRRTARRRKVVAEAPPSNTRPAGTPATTKKPVSDPPQGTFTLR